MHASKATVDGVGNDDYEMGLLHARFNSGRMRHARVQTTQGVCRIFHRITQSVPESPLKATAARANQGPSAADSRRFAPSIRLTFAANPAERPHAPHSSPSCETRPDPSPTRKAQPSVGLVAPASHAPPKASLFAQAPSRSSMSGSPPNPKPGGRENAAPL